MPKIANAKNKILADMDSVCEKLVAHSHWARKKKNYRILHELCRAEYECGNRDYSFSNLGVEWKRLGDSKAISWDTYIELPQTWAEVTDGILISRPCKSPETLMNRWFAPEIFPMESPRN
ncbi:MAG: hypothetical protein IPJ50_02710 [Betaproteobacteria bacterium]|jgi:hypothetical protein|nr:hypothetical protein [Betaproteobacteria bacterium]